MTTRKPEPVIKHGSGNVIADLGVPDADTHLLKAELVSRIDQILRQRRLTQSQAAGLLGISQPDVSRLLRGQFRRVSPNVSKLLQYARQPAQTGPSEGKDQAKQAVIRAALRTWDATPAGARALVRLLRSVEGLRRV